MTISAPTILIADPEPRSIESVFDDGTMARLRTLGSVLIHADGHRMQDEALHAALAQANIVIGQIDLLSDRLREMKELRAIFNIEGNFLQNLDYEYCFKHGIHVLVASSVFAEPVAEAALGMAIDLARGITETHEKFRNGTEEWGPKTNDSFFGFSRARVGIIGLGELGMAPRRMIMPFGCPVKVFDPWLSPRRIRAQGCTPVELGELLSTSQVIFVFAGATSENKGFLDSKNLGKIATGSVLLLMSRADVIEFPALVEAVASGRLRAGIDVFPEEPISRDHPVRELRGILLSSHRTGGTRNAFLNIGRLVVDDIELLLRGLPPQNCKRAEREIVTRLRSRPIAKNL